MARIRIHPTAARLLARRIDLAVRHQRDDVVRGLAARIDGKTGDVTVVVNDTEELEKVPGLADIRRVLAQVDTEEQKRSRGFAPGGRER
ncbi:hypothetical protein [Gordonia malaquae]|nr:hypothetical protein [Gordonia malaquae]